MRKHNFSRRIEIKMCISPFDLSTLANSGFNLLEGVGVGVGGGGWGKLLPQHLSFPPKLFPIAIQNNGIEQTLACQ